MNYFGVFFSIRRIGRVLNAQIKKLCGVTKLIDEIDEGVLRWWVLLERMDNDRVAKRVYVGECPGSGSVGRPRKTLIDTVTDCLRKKG